MMKKKKKPNTTYMGEVRLGAIPGVTESGVPIAETLANIERMVLEIHLATMLGADHLRVKTRGK